MGHVLVECEASIEARLGGAAESRKDDEHGSSGAMSFADDSPFLLPGVYANGSAPFVTKSALVRSGFL